MMKKKSFSLIFFTFAVIAVCPLYGEVIDKIAIVVNNEVITEGEVARLLGPIYEQYKTLYQGAVLIKKLDEARQKIIAQLIEDRLILGEAKKLNIEADEKDITAKIDEAVQRFGSKKQLEQALANQRMTLKDLRARYREQLMTRRLIDEKAGSKIVVTPVDIHNYYNIHTEEFVQPEELKIRNILIKIKSDVPTYKAFGLAKEILRRLREGGDFAGLAKVYSEGPGAQDGGLMGYVKKGDLMPEIEKAVFAMKDGETSAIIQTNLGYHIFKLEERKARKSLSLNEVRRQVEEKVFNDKLKKRIDEWLKDLKKNAYIAFK